MRALSEGFDEDHKTEHVNNKYFKLPLSLTELIAPMSAFYWLGWHGTLSPIAVFAYMTLTVYLKFSKRRRPAIFIYQSRCN